MGMVMEDLQRQPVLSGSQGKQLQLLHDLNQLRRVSTSSRVCRADILRRQLMQVELQNLIFLTRSRRGSSIYTYELEVHGLIAGLAVHCFWWMILYMQMQQQILLKVMHCLGKC